MKCFKPIIQIPYNGPRNIINNSTIEEINKSNSAIIPQEGTIRFVTLDYQKEYIPEDDSPEGLLEGSHKSDITRLINGTSPDVMVFINVGINSKANASSIINKFVGLLTEKRIKIADHLRVWNVRRAKGIDYYDFVISKNKITSENTQSKILSIAITRNKEIVLGIVNGGDEGVEGVVEGLLDDIRGNFGDPIGVILTGNFGTTNKYEYSKKGLELMAKDDLSYLDQSGNYLDAFMRKNRFIDSWMSELKAYRNELDEKEISNLKEHQNVESRFGRVHYNYVYGKFFKSKRIVGNYVYYDFANVFPSCPLVMDILVDPRVGNVVGIDLINAYADIRNTIAKFIKSDKITPEALDSAKVLYNTEIMDNVYHILESGCWPYKNPQFKSNNPYIRSMFVKNLIYGKLTTRMFEPVLNGKTPIMAILNSVKKNKVTIVRSDTGTGKTLTVPASLIEAGMLAPGRKIICTEPRIFNVMSAYARTCDLLGVNQYTDRRFVGENMAPWEMLPSNNRIDEKKIKDILAEFMVGVSESDRAQEEANIISEFKSNDMYPSVVGYAYSGHIKKEEPPGGVILVTDEEYSSAVKAPRDPENKQIIKYGSRENDYIRDQQIIYATEGILLNEIFGNFNQFMNRYQYVIIDEVHERNIDTDMLLAVIKAVIQINEKMRFVIMSATIDVTLFETYFGKGNCSIVDITGRKYAVSETFIKEPIDYKMTQLVSARFAVELHNRRDDPEGNDIIIFVSGTEDIVVISDEIKKYSISKRSKPFALLGVTRDTDKPIKDAVQKKTNETLQEYFIPEDAKSASRKIIVATNVAETGVTFNAKYVIDMGYHKIQLYSKEVAGQCLFTTRITKHNQAQRKGRVGRLFPGEYYGIFTKEEYNDMFESKIPGMAINVPNTQVLQMINFISSIRMTREPAKIIGPIDIDEFDLITKCPAENLLSAINVCLISGLIDMNLHLTQLGQIALKMLPIDPQMIRAILAGVRYKCTIEIIAISAILRNDSMYDIRGKKGTGIIGITGADKTTMRLFQTFIANQFGSDSINALTTFMIYLTRAKKQGNPKTWCYERYLNYFALTKIEKQFYDTLDICAQIGIPLLSSTNFKYINKYSAENILKALHSGFWTNELVAEVAGENIWTAHDRITGKTQKVIIRKSFLYSSVEFLPVEIPKKLFYLGRGITFNGKYSVYVGDVNPVPPGE